MRAARNHVRRGLTLVELLVTITILVMLIGVTIPLMRSVGEGQQLTQATQQVELLFDSARSQALADGSAGVIFLRSRNPGEQDRCYQVALAKTPPPYAGEVTNARIHNAEELANPLWKIDFVLGHIRPLMNPAMEPEGWFIRPGDEIRFNYRGARHPIVFVREGVQEDRRLIVSLEVILKHTVPFSNSTTFQIFRQPRQTSTPPIELPNGTFIDLSATGVELDEFGNPLAGLVFNGGQPMITFGSTGNMDKVFRGHEKTVDLDQMQQQMFPDSPRGALQIDIVRLTGTQETHEHVSLATRRAEIKSTKSDHQ